MGMGPATRPRTASVLGLRSYVVHRGLRHVAIDVLPREPMTLRAACGQDIIAREDPSGDCTDCQACLRFERTWLLVKSTAVI